MKGFLCLVASAALTVSIFYAQSGFADTSEELKALKNEVMVIKERQAAMQKDIQEMRKLLTSRSAAPAAPAAQPAEFKEAIINVQSAPSKGSKDAKLALIEFSDYQ